MEAAQSLPAVSQVYLFLGKCFSYPREGFYNAMGDEHTEEQLRIMVEGLPFEVHFKSMPPPSMGLDEMESEYINTFDLAYGSQPPCSLYESAYKDGGTCSRDIIEELLRFYDHFDVRLSEKEKDFPNHLVVELEFMAFLAQKEAEAVRLGKDPKPYRLAQADFLERHLAKWVPKFAVKIQKTVKEPFYQVASSFLRGFLLSHLSHLRQKPVRPIDAAKNPFRV